MPRWGRPGKGPNRWRQKPLELPQPAAPPCPFYQTDWPNPTISKKAGEVVLIANLLLTALAIGPQTLRAPVLTPQPPARQVQQPLYQQNLLGTTLGIPPFGLDDWPQPQAIKRWQPTDSQNLLTSVLGSVGGPFAGSVQSPPRPPQATRQEFIPSNLLLTTLAPVSRPFVQTDWLNPAIPAKSQQQTDPPSLLETTLNPAAQAIFRLPLDVSLRAVSRQPQDSIAPNVTLLATPAALPFGPDDWSNPTLWQRGFEPPPPENLLPLTAAPFAQADWPTPQQFKRQPSVDQQNLLVSTLAPAVGAPFPGSVQSPPSARAAVRQEFVAPNLLLTTLAPTGQPFAQTDWTTRSAARSVQPPFDSPNIIGTTLATPVVLLPFGPDDWPQPAPRPQPVQVWNIPNFLETVPAQPVVVPFGPDDWPNPIKARAPQIVIIPGRLSTTVVAAAGTPFKQTDWTTRSAARSVQSSFDSPNLLTTTLATGPQAPVAIEDWPHQLVRPRRVQQTEFVQDLLTTTLSGPPPPKPFHQDIWLNPIGRVGRQLDQIRNDLSLFHPPPPPVKPFQQSDWKNPIYRPRPQAPPAQNLLTLLAPQGPPITTICPSVIVFTPLDAEKVAFTPKDAEVVTFELKETEFVKVC